MAIITEALPADSAVGLEAPAIAPNRVMLDVVNPEGVGHPLTPTDETGRYELQLQVEPGERYELRGTIDGRQVVATTTVPTTFVIRQPAADTITAADGRTEGLFLQVPYVFEAPDAAGFEARVIYPDGVVSRDARTETTGELVFL